MRLAQMERNAKAAQLVNLQKEKERIQQELTSMENEIAALNMETTRAKANLSLARKWEKKMQTKVRRSDRSLSKSNNT